MHKKSMVFNLETSKREDVFMVRKFLAGAAMCLLSTSLWAAVTIPNALSSASKECIDCHQEETTGIYQQWGASKHFRANVGCYECHQANKKDPDAFEHEGYTISIIVSPKDCARCHEKEVREFEESHHSKAGQILGSLDNFLADVVEGNNDFYGGSALTVSGCKQCHGAPVEVNPDGSLKPTGWPNTGIGRFNPDGSVGSCTACHQRHAFSAAQARRPENCGKCHLGPDHPQKEIYEESKHGIAYRAHEAEMNLDNAKWVLGEDYSAAPTCATCHMSAVRTKDGEFLPVTHDVGLRISWNNRPPTSVRPEVSDKKLGLTKAAAVKWQERRENMQKVCTVCHTDGFVSNFYEQYDGVINLYNKKFGTPGKKIMKALRENKLITETKFDEEIEWAWWEIWHHQGRRARHGVSMMGPDYTHWHGLYDVAQEWYMKFIPEVKHIIAENLKSKDKNKVAAAKRVEQLLNGVLNSADHRWFIGKMSPEEKARRKKAQEEFKKRYTK